MSTPVVPARPTRSQAAPATTVTDASQVDQPQIPPRPIRKTDPSPSREAYTRSPLYNLPGNAALGRPTPQPISQVTETPRRPPSVSFPSDAGQEGAEYDSYENLPTEAPGATQEQTRNVSADMPLHAPKASFAQSTAKSRIASVTRLDSVGAIAAGLPPPSKTEEELHNITASSPLGRVTSSGEQPRRAPSTEPYNRRAPSTEPYNRRAPSTEPHPLRARASFNRSNVSLSGRPSSIHSVDHHDGIPAFGVQVPLLMDRGDVQAPSPGPTQSQHTPGIGFFNDGSGKNHHRKRSSRHEFGPPDSYGLHGHGQLPQDQFEREWIQKHPDLAAKEGYATFQPRPSTAMSMEQLNKLVHMNQSGAGGVDRGQTETPTQQEIAFDATDIYTTHMGLRKRGSSGQQPQVELHLRKGSESGYARSEAMESEDERTYHIDPHYSRGNKVTGGGPADGALDLESEAGVLASDEIIKRPGSAFQEPAVPPEYHEYEYARRGSQPSSRPSSRPSSMHGGHHGNALHRFVSHEAHENSGAGTPLEEIEEYEPLFPDDDDTKPQAVKKMRALAQHHFPSQDVWEDSPSSLQYETTVDTPEPPHEEKETGTETSAAGVFETPEQEQLRREANPHDMSSSSKTFIKPHFKPGVQAEARSGRPGVQRFPSSDIWEDTPDSMRLETTVSGPQMDEVLSPPEERPTTAALPGNQDDSHVRSTTGLGQLKPHVPGRPERRSKLAQEVSPGLEGEEKEVPDMPRAAPSIPDRPKPTVPARPQRGSQDAPEVAKSKPAVPARPAGNKIAALQAGFMNDLNKRLQLGPQAPPKAREAEVSQEEPAEKAPLADARKGRAKGPSRRKPASSPSSGASQLGFSFSFSSPMTLFQIDESDELTVGRVPSLEASHPDHDDDEIEEDEPAEHPTTTAPSSEDLGHVTHVASAIGHPGDIPDPSVSPATVEKQAAIAPLFAAALNQAEPAPQSAEQVAQIKALEAAQGRGASPQIREPSRPEPVRDLESADDA